MPEAPQNEKAWYIVGWLEDYDSTSPADYLRIKQSLIKFTFLRHALVEFDIGAGTSISLQEYTILFQSLQHCQAFYAIAYDGVNLTPAVSLELD